MKLLCKLFGHKWKYNLIPFPNKRICAECKRKEATTWSEWVEVRSFYFDLPNGRTDKELINKWTKLPK